MKHMPAVLFDSGLARISKVEQPDIVACHAFDLPPVLHGVTVACYFGFLGVMAAAFGARDMAIPFGIFFLFVAMGFAVPAMWARIAPRRTGPAPTWADFRYRGIECGSGHLSAGAAIGQVLALPVLILFWSVAIVVIVASV